MIAVTKNMLLERLQLTPKELKAYERELIKTNSKIKKAYLLRLILVGVCWIATKYVCRFVFNLESIYILVPLALGAILLSSFLLTIYVTNPILLDELSNNVKIR